MTHSPQTLSEGEVGFLSDAAPVWDASLVGQMNIVASFHAKLSVAPAEEITVRLSASCIYRLWLNGKFLGYGPARTAHGYARIDEWAAAADQSGKAEIVIEVSSNGVPTFCEAKQPAYLCAEVLSGSRPLAWTGDTGGFVAERRSELVQKIERYSFMRGFCEGYELATGEMVWLKPGYQPARRLTLSRIAKIPQWLARVVEYPDLSIAHPLPDLITGSAIFSEAKAAKVSERRFIHHIPRLTPGYLLNEMEWPLFKTLAGVEFTSDASQSVRTDQPFTLKEGRWARADFKSDHTGFISLKIRAEKSTRVILLFDEVLIGDQIEFDRMDTLNAIWFHFAEGGEIDFESLEPYTFGFLTVLVWNGTAEISEMKLRNYSSGAKISPAPKNLSADELVTWNAAVESFRQNALDLFTDCPGRERSGYPCDSFFTARAEWLLTGDNIVERAFLENYLLPEAFDGVPAGMVPMCYPGEVLDQYIPNWGMFLIVQLGEARRLRHVPAEWDTLIERRVRTMLEYFRKFENEEGLLEKLENWVFVEWSKANEFVQDISFPTNFLYAAMLRESAHLLHDESLLAKADRVEAAVMKYSFRDGIFVDNALRSPEGKIEPTTNSSEVCQYYALFFGSTTPASDPALWHHLMVEMHGKLFPVNTFIGMVLRLDLLIQTGKTEMAQHEMMAFFLHMARKTGTLWENADDRASCNHGFTAYIAVLLDQLASAAGK